MSDTGGIIYPGTEWNANDYANIITISAAAISSVLLVIFKSRCKKIDLCCGAVNCLRDPKEEDEETPALPKKPNPKPKPTPSVEALAAAALEQQEGAQRGEEAA
jgi:hypothetical protein